MDAESQLKNEIARLTATINQHKSNPPKPSTFQPRSNAYVNPNYKPPSRTYIRPVPHSSKSVPTSKSTSATPKEVVLNGVAFQSSGRSLVRKDLPESAKPPSLTGSTSFARKSGHLVSSARVYKPTASRGRRPRGGARGVSNRNMTLTNNRRPYKSRAEAKRLKYMNKPCPRFTTTGACSRGLTCMYQHDPAKIAICWSFLQGNCPNTAETCDLSHDPTPERTPLCVHFVNRGRCTRERCPFPHVKLGPREGICRDFAVLGYCEKGLECDKQHVRECPDFAETGACKTKGCKLPHVIRANRTRKPTTTSNTPTLPTIADNVEDVSAAVGQDAQIGDEYISLTFNESEEESSDDENLEEEEASDAESASAEAEEDEQPISVHA